MSNSGRNRSTRTVVSPALAAIVLVLPAAACGDSGSRDSDPSEDPGEVWQEPGFGGLDSADIRLNLPWSRNRVTKDPNPDAEPARLTAVSTEELAEYDRVVFTFEERIPGYRLAFLTEGGGGCDGTEAAGDAPAHLSVEFERARSNDGGVPLVEDRDRRTGFPVLAGATQSCDEGGTVRWLLAAGGETDYRIVEMVDKPRLVVDLRHP